MVPCSRCEEPSMTTNCSPTPTRHRPCTTVVVVTYGDRWSLLERVLQSVDQPEFVRTVVVVDNGAREGLAIRLAESKWATEVVVVGDGINRGSAGGFALGLATARQRARDGYVLMLDDDNELAKGALERLLQELPSADVPVALLMNRGSRPEIARATTTGERARLANSPYCGYSLGRAIIRRLRYCRGMIEDGDLLVDYAPYGGLLMSMSVLDAVGLPDRRYYLYVDDHEFTSRIPLSGTPIRLVKNSLLNDLETSWHQLKRTFVAAVDPATPEFRAFYYVRNRRYFERTRLRRSAVVEAMNALFFLTLVAIDISRLLVSGESWQHVHRRLVLLRRAARAGAEGRLGRADVI